MQRKMRTPLVAALIVAGAAGFWGATVTADPDRQEKDVQPVAGIQTYLIEFTEAGMVRQLHRSPGERFDPKTPEALAYRDELMRIQAEHKADIAGVLGRYPDVTHHYLATHSGIAARLTAEEAARVADLDWVASVEAETMETIVTNTSPAFIGANTIWNGTNVPGGVGTRGEGMVIAVLDTGLHPNAAHPAFTNDPSCGHGAANPAKILSNLDCSSADGTGLCNGPSPADGNGHGSHTASTSGGNAVTTAAPTLPPANNVSGIAPCASLRIYEVCPTTSCPGAAIQSGMDSILLHGDVDAMNFSISGGTSPWTDNDRKKLDLVNAGVLVVASAGNTSGGVPNPVGQVNHRGPWVLSVAASTHDPGPGDALASFSLRGPTPAPLVDLQKPDITAPGVGVYAANISPAAWGDNSGTSMSGPHVAGAGALIRKIHPTWTPMEVRSALMMTAKRTGTGVAGNWTADEVGHGRVDLTKAARTGLVMNETFANMLAANPATNPTGHRDLNLPAVRDLTCGQPAGCSWTRTVRSTLSTPSTWNVASESPTGFTLQATPANFNIPAGGTQVITITATPNLGEPGSAVRFGAVTFTRAVGGTEPVEHITVAVQGAGLLDPIFANGFESPPPIVCSTGTITIPDSGPASVYPVPLAFPAGPVVTSLRFTVNGFTHTFPNDVDFLLAGPAGQKYIFQSDVGGTAAVTGINYTLADNGAALIPTPLVAGNHRPSNSGANDAFPAPAPAAPYTNAAPGGADTFASVFGTSSGNGTWNVFIVDDAGGDTGTITSVCLEINPPP